jgi:glycosyltransferase involved in cell wall biosynthesis
MKVLGIINKDSAVAYHRITMPLLLMDDVDALVTNNITDETFTDNYEVVFYSRLLNDYAFDKINEMRRKHGFKLIIDVDDYWILDKWHPMYQDYIAEDYHMQQIKNMVNADAVFVTNERLYTEAVTYNEHTYIIPNAIPPAGQFVTTRTEPSDRVRLFWQGSVTHEEDINLIRYAIEMISNTHKDKIEMVMAGFHPEIDIWVRMAKMYTLNKRLQNKLFQGMTYETYYKSYAHADICLVPLVNSRFNSMKSNLKILEAGNLSLPVITHHVMPYLDMPVRYAQGTMDWHKAMKYYIDNPNARYDDGAKLNEFCNTWYNYRSINQTRKEVFDEVRQQANIRCT